MPDSNSRSRAAAQDTAHRTVWSDTERKLADDLHTHQIELRMQNQELVRARNEIERSRARYFDLFDFAPVAYFTLNARGTIANLNLAASELVQADRQRLLGAPLTAFLDETSQARLLAHLAAAFADPGKHTIELVLAGSRGGALRRHIHVSSRAIRGETGEARLCLSAAIDITAGKAAEEEITRLNHALEDRVAQRTAELEDSNRDLEAFIYSISHDLRAPLRNMAGFATIIDEDFGPRLPAEVRHHVQRILAGNHKMLHLVDDLLRFSRLGRTRLEVTRTDLNELVEEALAELAHDVAGRDIVWRRSPLPVASCDRALMRQVFINLLSNALKYSRPRQPAVISIGTEIRNAERVVFVQDNGVGFDMRSHDKLFGVFQRLHSPSEFEGNGVGLAMIARILHRHGGAAYAEGHIHQGATFWFTFEGLRSAC